MPAGKRGFVSGKKWNGNAKGRPKGSLNRYSIAELQQAIGKVENTKVGKKKRSALLVHYVEEAYKDNSVLISLMKKMLPDLKSIEATGGILVGSMDEDTAKSIQKKLKKRFD